MAKVNTILGPVDVNDLGITLMHEHILAVDPIMAWHFDDWFNREIYVKHACRIIEDAKRLGVKTIVDQSTIDIFRWVDIMKEVAEKAEINLIMSTGFYYNDRPVLFDKDVSYIAELMIRELEHGIGKTGVKPAMIKCASYASGVNKNNEKILRATAMAHKATGAPIGTHSELETGYIQQDIFESEGVALDRVIIGHLGDLDNAEYIDYMEKVGKRGSYLGMDRFGIDPIMPLDKRVETVAELCRRGFTEKVVLGHDYIVWADFKDSIPVHGCAFGDVDWNFLLNHDVQFSYISKIVVPLLRKNGLSEEAIHTMLVDVPRRFFTK